MCPSVRELWLVAEDISHGDARSGRALQSPSVQLQIDFVATRIILFSLFIPIISGFVVVVPVFVHLH